MNAIALASEVLPDMHVLFTELLETVKQKVDGTVS